MHRTIMHPRMKRVLETHDIHTVRMHINKCDSRRRSPLHHACRDAKGCDIVRRLLAIGADPNVKDYANYTVMH